MEEKEIYVEITDMEYSFKWYFLRWILRIAQFFDGMIGIITLGFYCPDLTFSAEVCFMDEHDCLMAKSKKHFEKCKS